MAEVLGLSVSDYPIIHEPPRYMAARLARLVESGWAEKPHLQDTKNWPEAMREEWGNDKGEAAGARAQERQVAQYRRLRVALDDFAPDFMLLMYREHTDVFGSYARSPYTIQAHEKLSVKIFDRRERGNVFGEDPDRVDVLRGHPEGALHLVRALQDRGFNPLYTLEPLIPDAGRPRHSLLAAALHLDWDRREFKTPIVPMGFDPFGFLRTRTERGLSPWDRGLPRPLLPSEAFELGRGIAQAFRASPWRVALVAGVDWSHNDDSASEFERIHPDIDADRRRFEQWKNNEFRNWGRDWTFEEMEKHAQWELLIAIVLAGAMTELDARVVHADFSPNYVVNANFVTTIFEVK